jgi:hypothetical protein
MKTFPLHPRLELLAVGHALGGLRAFNLAWLLAGP